MVCIDLTESFDVKCSPASIVLDLVSDDENEPNSEPVNGKKKLIVLDDVIELVTTTASSDRKPAKKRDL